MISTVRGTVLDARGSTVVIELGGVGLLLNVTPAQALVSRPGAEAFLHTALIVREDELSLFGFATRDELELFDLLRGVSGVGPKSALGVLATLTPDDIARAVAAEDDAPFRKVSGIGPKTAKLITISLAGKVAAPSPTRSTPSRPVGTDASVVAALVGLGWPEKVAGQAVSEVLAEATADEQGNVQVLLRLALARLSSAGTRPQRAGAPS
jgi:Holliday junction DNA helicase RuvA